MKTEGQTVGTSIQSCYADHQDHSWAGEAKKYAGRMCAALAGMLLLYLNWDDDLVLDKLLAVGGILVCKQLNERLCSQVSDQRVSVNPADQGPADTVNWIGNKELFRRGFASTIENK